MNIQKTKTKGIGFKTLCNFLLIISIIILLIWLLEIILFEPIYRKIQTSKIQTIQSEIVTNYQTYDMDDYFSISMKNNCNILIFKINNQEAQILTNTSRTNNPIELNIIVNQFIKQLSNQTNVSYITQTENSDIINVGEVRSFDSENIYFFVNSAITPADSAIEVSTKLLLIISITGLLIAVFVSYLLSKKLSQPLQKLSNQAKQLSGGNLDVKFEASGYDEVETLASTLNYSIQQIKKSDVLQKEVVQNVSHELRTPLTIIQSYAELIEDYSGETPEKRQKHTKIIIEESKKLEQLISDLLDLSKMQAHTLEYNYSKFNLSESIEKLEVFYKNKYKDFSFEFNYIKKSIINADKQRIEQVLVNIINNAINYSLLEQKKVEISLKKLKNQNYYRFMVKDYGIGISQEDIKTIFTRHFRSINSRRATAGSGVGLTIAKQVLDHHKIDVKVESRLGEGSTFYIDFPMA